jgi:superfamily II DNA/RNA helicase
VGINGPAQTVVLFGCPQTPEDMVQKIGRIRKPDGQARGIVYLPRGYLKAARAVVDADLKGQSQQTESPAKQPNSASVPKEKKKKEKSMDIGIAKIIMANCIYS